MSIARRRSTSIESASRPITTTRFVQLTPPGSACSIAIGSGLTASAPGSAQGLLLVVSDIDSVRTELVERGVEVSEVRAEEWGARHAYFQDPDGNSWQLQQPA